MFIYIHVLSYYKRFLYFNMCLECNVRYSLMFIYIHITLICVLSVMSDSSVHLHPYPFLLQAVPLLLFVSKCDVRYSLMFIYIHIHSYYKLFLYFNLRLSVMLYSLSCSFTFISFLTSSCSFTLICILV